MRYISNDNTTIFIKVEAVFVVALGTGLKLLLWSITFANLRYYAFITLAINVVVVVRFAWIKNFFNPEAYIFGILNFAIQLSPMTGMGPKAALFQWLILSINLIASLLIPYYLGTFPGEIPALNAYISPLKLLPSMMAVIVVVSTVVELLSFKHLSTAWNV